jgi:hypothetical protein
MLRKIGKIKSALRFIATLQVQAAKECYYERSEAISRLWGLLSHGTRDSHKSTPILTDRLQLTICKQPRTATFRVGVVIMRKKKQNTENIFRDFPPCLFKQLITAAVRNKISSGVGHIFAGLAC